MQAPRSSAEFFREWFTTSAVGYVNVIDVSPGKFANPRTTSFPASDLDRAGQYVASLGQDRQVYFEVSTQLNPSTPDVRGKKKGVIAVPGMWFDLDVRDAARHKGTDLPTNEEALAFIASLPLQPTAIISTGGGYHLYWRFDQLQILDISYETE